MTCHSRQTTALRGWCCEASASGIRLIGHPTREQRQIDPWANISRIYCRIMSMTTKATTQRCSCRFPRNVAGTIALCVLHLCSFPDSFKAKPPTPPIKPRRNFSELRCFRRWFSQVKAFLADARPANSRRPVSAPAHIESGGGSIGGLDVVGGGGVGGMARSRAGGRAGLEVARRPGTAGAALGRGGSGGFGDEYQVPTVFGVMRVFLQV